MCRHYNKVHYNKVSNGLSSPVVSNVFTQKNCHSYNLRLNSQFSRPLVRSVFHGIEIISYLGSVIWYILPDSYKNLLNFIVFKKRIKKWKPERTVPADFAKHTFLESALHRLLLR